MQARRRFRSILAKTTGLIALTLLLAWPVQADAADPNFTFWATDSATGTLSYGELYAVNNGNGTYTAVSGFLSVLSGPLLGAYALVPNPDPPYIFFVPGFFEDDLLYPGQNPTLDGAGLSFAGNGLEINIWGTGPGTYQYAAFNGYYYNFIAVNPHFSLSAPSIGP